MKFGMWTTIGQKTTQNELEIATATFSLTTTTKTTAQATGGGGVRGSRGRGIEGPHHHQQDLTNFFPLVRAAFTGNPSNRNRKIGTDREVSDTADTRR